MKTEKDKIIEEINVICDHNKRICKCLLCKKEVQKALQSQKQKIIEEIENE